MIFFELLGDHSFHMICDVESMSALEALAHKATIVQQTHILRFDVLGHFSLHEVERSFIIAFLSLLQ